MNDYVFADQAKTKFRYLIDSYGFTVVDELYDPEAFGNSLVQYRSASLDIYIILDRGRVLVDIAPYPNVSNYRFGLLSFIEYLAPELGEIEYIYPDEPEDYNGKIDWQVERVAGLLQQYCAEPVLTGEFSAWAELDERREKEALTAYRKMTGKDPIKIESEALREELEQELNTR